MISILSQRPRADSTGQQGIARYLEPYTPPPPPVPRGPVCNVHAILRSTAERQSRNLSGELDRERKMNISLLFKACRCS